jgi:hypothetical protein
MLIMQPFQKAVLLALLAAVALLGFAPSAAPAAAADAAQRIEKVRVDVAQNMLTFVADEAPVHEDGMPAYGNPFIIQGFIYPEGTLNGSNGIVVSEDAAGNPIAEPEFPDKVMGTWICRGCFIGDGLHTQAEPWAVSTQIFDLGDGFGDVTIVSDGYEIPFGLDAAVHRAIVGGTGPYVGAYGEQVQKLVGINATQAANFRIELNLARSNRGWK